MLSVGQAAKRVGLRVSAVHFYERKGLLPPVPRQGERRQYDDAHLRRLVFLHICQQARLSLDDIAILLDARPAIWKRLLAQRLDQVKRELAELEKARQTLTDALRCPAEHPVDECPHVNFLIDAQLAEPLQT
jgi:DNA-binding transcriptional MerR regulator